MAPLTIMFVHASSAKHALLIGSVWRVSSCGHGSAGGQAPSPGAHAAYSPCAVAQAEPLPDATVVIPAPGNEDVSERES